MKQKEAKGQIQWIDEECVGFKCECGEEIVVGIPFENDDAVDGNICPKCGKRYILIQSNEVFEAIIYSPLICDGCGKHKQLYYLDYEECFYCEDCCKENGIDIE